MKAIENAEELSIEDLALISAICRSSDNRSYEMSFKYVQAIKPVVLQSWSSEEFKEIKNENATSIASLLVKAVASVMKYPD